MVKRRGRGEGCFFFFGFRCFEVVGEGCTKIGQFFSGVKEFLDMPA